MAITVITGTTPTVWDICTTRESIVDGTVATGTTMVAAVATTIMVITTAIITGITMVIITIITTAIITVIMMTMTSIVTVAIDAGKQKLNRNGSFALAEGLFYYTAQRFI